MGKARSERFENEREDLVARTERRYLEAFQDVRVSIEHTATEGWQRLYQGHQAELKAQRLAIGKTMADQAETLDSRLLVEDEEKYTKDAIKQNAELRAFEAAWEKQVDKYDRAILAAASKPEARLRQLSDAAPGLCASAINRRSMDLVRQGMLRMTTDGPRGPIFETTTKGLHALRSDQ